VLFVLALAAHPFILAARAWNCQRACGGASRLTPGGDWDI
jgi:hypothetical protein